MEQQVIFGTSVLFNSMPKIEKEFISLPGRSLNGDKCIKIEETTFSKHLLLLGGSGCGKTNTFLFITNELRKHMTPNDFMIVFDTKGEFYDEFFRNGDYVIGNSTRFRPISSTWNLFDEILADGWDEENVNMNAREMAAALFHGRGSSSQPFFCNAARDIFRGILLHFVRQAKKNPEKYQSWLNNADLMKALQGFKVSDYIKIFNYYSDLRGLLTYFGDGKSNQALGVFGELNSMLSEYFVGVLAEYNPNRSLSMRQAVRQQGGKAIFVEYDLSVGETLSPIYRLLIDQALKEALSREHGKKGNDKIGKVYLIADEFKLLPKLQHIDDALNFGRGLGVRVVAGIQSISQLYDAYGEDKGAVIASGFGSLFAYHTNDGPSRDYVTKRFGSNVSVYGYDNTQKRMREYSQRDGNTVEEWDQINLGIGQTVVGLGHQPPFLFQFDEYDFSKQTKSR